MHRNNSIVFIFHIFRNIKSNVYIKGSFIFLFFDAILRFYDKDNKMKHSVSNSIAVLLRFTELLYRLIPP